MEKFDKYFITKKDNLWQILNKEKQVIKESHDYFDTCDVCTLLNSL